MARIALLLGGNRGDMKRTLQTAQQLVNTHVGAVLRCSHRYESPAWGFRDSTLFSNQALEVSTDLAPLEVLDACQAIERALGRNRAAEMLEKTATGAAYAARPIDIDLIFYDDRIIDSERLTVPHPRLAEREFALVPLAEIMRSRRHPVSGRTVGELLDALRATKADPAAKTAKTAHLGPTSEPADRPTNPDRIGAPDHTANNDRTE